MGNELDIHAPKLGVTCIHACEHRCSWKVRKTPALRCFWGGGQGDGVRAAEVPPASRVHQLPCNGRQASCAAPSTESPHGANAGCRRAVLDAARQRRRWGTQLWI